MYDNILNEYSRSEIVQICKYLNREYNIYDTEAVRWEKIKYVLFRTPTPLLQNLQKETYSNQFINNLLLKYYPCERVVKYHFIKLLKGAPQDIVAFEMTVGSSRIDICRINGKLCAYEIKTEYDNYDRLNAQMKDYFKSFERVYIIVPSRNANIAQDYVPHQCGIITYRLDENNNLIFAYRRAAKNTECDIKFCLNNLSGNDLIRLIKLLKLKPLGTKEKNLEFLLQLTKKENLWPKYRILLKDKYGGQWCHLKENFEKILPIDCQSFFSSGMDPDLLYEREKKHMAY